MQSQPNPHHLSASVTSLAAPLAAHNSLAQQHLTNQKRTRQASPQISLRDLLEVSPRLLKREEFGGNPEIYSAEGWFPEFPAMPVKNTPFKIITSAPEDSIETGNFLTIIPLEQLRAKYAPIVAQWPYPQRAQQSMRPIEPILQKFIHECLEIIGENYNYDLKDIKPMGPYISPPGYQAISFNSAVHRVIGMHIDSIGGSGLETRPRGFNRFCLNLGNEPRKLQFIPLTAKTIHDYGIAQKLFENHGNICPDLYVRRFFQHNPNIEVYSLSVPPFCAYIAPTENIPHDGSTWERKTVDASFMLIGKFLPKSTKPLPHEAIFIE